MFRRRTWTSEVGRWTFSSVECLSLRILCGPIAQLVEQLAFNQWVAGSSPARLSILLRKLEILPKTTKLVSHKLLPFLARNDDDVRFGLVFKAIVRDRLHNNPVHHINLAKSQTLL